MGCAAGVVAREDGLELGDTRVVGLLNSTEESRVQVGLIGGVAVAAGHNARVDAGGIAVPEVEVDVRDGF